MAKKLMDALVEVLDYSTQVIVRVDPIKLIAYVVVGMNELGDREVKAVPIYDTTDAHIIMHNLKKSWTRKDGSVVANPHIGKTPGLKFFAKIGKLHISRTVVTE